MMEQDKTILGLKVVMNNKDAHFFPVDANLEITEQEIVAQFLNAMSKHSVTPFKEFYGVYLNCNEISWFRVETDLKY